MFANSRENDPQEKIEAVRSRQTIGPSAAGISGRHSSNTHFQAALSQDAGNASPHNTSSGTPSQKMSDEQTKHSQSVFPSEDRSPTPISPIAGTPVGSERNALDPFNETADDSITKSLSPVMAEEKLLSTQQELPEIRIDGDMLELGVVFDEYELIRFIGGGGMGNVWLAQDSNLNRLVALKVLHSDKSMNPEVIQRFYSEAQVAAMLNHPNITQIYAFRDHRESHRMFLTMEYVRGENLRDRVKNHGPMSVSETILIALQISHALNHMAQRKIVHRDIKPSNILLTKEGEAKLIDLGLARISYSALDGGPGFEHYIPNDITASGVTLGTFDYISPEQARDPRNVDTRSDIYSLGCTLFYLLTGHPPFPQGTPLQKLLQHQSDNPMDVSLSRIDVPDSLNRILTRTMMKNPDERYAQPEELIADLEMAAQEAGIPLKNSLFTSPLAEPSVFSSFSASKTLQFLFAQMCWIVPILFFGTGLWFLEKMWTPPFSDGELPPPPGIPKRESPNTPTAAFPPENTPSEEAIAAPSGNTNSSQTEPSQTLPGQTPSTVPASLEAGPFPNESAPTGPHSALPPSPAPEGISGLGNDTSAVSDTPKTSSEEIRQISSPQTNASQDPNASISSPGVSGMPRVPGRSASGLGSVPAEHTVPMPSPTPDDAPLPPPLLPRVESRP